MLILSSAFVFAAIQGIEGKTTAENQGGQDIDKLFNFDESDIWHTNDRLHTNGTKALGRSLIFEWYKHYPVIRIYILCFRKAFKYLCIW